MTPKISGNIGSRKSEGSNKNVSFKRISPNLKMLNLMARNRPKRMLAGHSQVPNTEMLI